MLQGKNIILRPLRNEDLEKTHEWRNNLELIELTQGIRFPKTLEMEREWFDKALNDKSNRNIYFGIDEVDTKVFIGIIQLNSIDYISGIAKIGIVIGDSNVKGKGYGKEAMKLLLSYAYNVLNLRKIGLEVIIMNERAIFLYKKLGFLEEGRLKKHNYFNGEYQDVIIMSLFREDFQKKKE